LICLSDDVRTRFHGVEDNQESARNREHVAILWAIAQCPGGIQHCHFTTPCVDLQNLVAVPALLE
jgi:hypothetical protein